MNEKGESEVQREGKKKDTFSDRTLGAKSGGLCKKICFTIEHKDHGRTEEKCKVLASQGSQLHSHTFTFEYI